MSVAPDPEEIFDRAADEGTRRLDQSLLELLATSFIAGFTVVFGLAGLGAVHALVPARFGGLAQIAGALAFAPALVFLVIGRTELLNENFSDPVASAVESDSWPVGSLLRLWVVTFVFNLAGGIVFGYVVAVRGVLPAGSGAALVTVAEELVHRRPLTAFASAIVGGALVALLSFLLQGVNAVGIRIPLSFAVGFLLALGPFDHVVVTVLHIVLGMFSGAQIASAALGEILLVSTAGNVVGGLGLVMFTHVLQLMGARDEPNQ